MEGYVTHRLNLDVRVRIGRSMPELAEELDREVEQLWQQAVRDSAASGGRLFNGHVFSADAITPETILGHFTEFRRVIAQLARPRLFDTLGLRPLAACGVLRCSDGVVVGRRHPTAIYEAGMWQLPPAGSVDGGAMADDGEVDLPRQLLNELEEELGLLPEEVTAPCLLCIVEHPSHVCDVGMALSTALDARSVLARHRERGNGEYPVLQVVPEPRTPAFVAEHRGSLVPSATVFLAYAGLLPSSCNGRSFSSR